MKKVLLATLFVGSLVAAGQAVTLRDHIKMINSKVEVLFKKKDVAGFEKFMRPLVTKDYQFIEEGKSATFDEMVAQLGEGFKMLGDVTATRARLLTLKETGDSATSTQSHDIYCVNIGADKKQHKMAFLGRSTHTYVRVNGKWLLSKMQVTSTKVTMDGKPMKMDEPAQGK